MSVWLIDFVKIVSSLVLFINYYYWSLLYSPILLSSSLTGIWCCTSLLVLSELRSCVKVEVDVLGSLSLISLRLLWTWSNTSTIQACFVGDAGNRCWIGLLVLLRPLIIYKVDFFYISCWGRWYIILNFVLILLRMLVYSAELDFWSCWECWYTVLNWILDHVEAAGI